MKRALWFMPTVLVLLIMLLYARQVDPSGSAYADLNYAFLYDMETGVRIQITADMVPYIGLVTLYSVGVLYVMNTALALQRDFVTFVMCRFNSRRAFAIWNLRSILGSSITFTLSLVAAILIGMAVLFHTVSGIGSEASWLLLINLCLTFAWIGHVAVYVSLRHGHFAAAVSGMMVLVAIFSIVIAFNGVATVTFSNPQAMAWGVVLSGAVYIATAVFLKVSLGNMDL